MLAADAPAAALRAPSARLDAWTIISRTSHPEAPLAVALDLRELALQDVEEMAVCRGLQMALLSSNLLGQVGRGIFSCTRLRKLDLANNGLSVLPPKEDWARMAELLILYLHDNHLASLHAIGEITGAPALVRLTMHGNPCAKHPSYRHFCVNTIVTLKALDLHIISDEELIEGAHFGNRFGTKCPSTELPLVEPAMPTGAEPGAGADERLLSLIQQEYRPY
jgi:Leucine-rich repeat (LRR) protein